MDLHELLTGLGRHLSARGLAERTRASYLRVARLFFARLGAAEPSRADIEAFIGRLAPTGAPRLPATKRAELIALRVAFRYLGRQHGMADLTQDIVVKRGPKKAPSFVTPEEVPLLFRAAETSSERHRDMALLGLLYVFGLRLSEVARLRVEQLETTTNTLRDVRGKGGTVVSFAVPAPLRALLDAWIRERALRGHGHHGPLFPSARPATGAVTLSVRTIERAVSRIAKRAGIERPIGPHSLRHACGTSATWLGVPLMTTSACLRHTDPATSAVYIHLVHDERSSAFATIATLIPSDVLPPTTSRGGPDALGGDPLDVHPL